MSRFDEELRARILRGDPIPSVRMWFIERVAESPDIKLSDFTPLESRFWQDTCEDFKEWEKSQTLNSTLRASR
jgi:hypothetical protein